MFVAYYTIKFPNTFSINQYECPIEYFMKKYSFDLSIPRGVVDNNEFIMCIPMTIENEFVDILITEEDCVANLIKYDDLSRDDFTDSFVYINKTNKCGSNKEDYIIVYK